MTMSENEYIKKLKALKKERDFILKRWGEEFYEECKANVRQNYKGEYSDIIEQRKCYSKLVKAIKKRMAGIITKNQPIFKSLKVCGVVMSYHGVSSIHFSDRFDVVYKLMLMDEDFSSDESKFGFMRVSPEEFFGYNYDFNPERVNDVVFINYDNSFELIDNKGRKTNIKLYFDKEQEAKKYFLALVLEEGGVIWKHNITKFVPKDLVE